MVGYKIGGGVNCYDCWRGSVPHHDVVVSLTLLVMGGVGVKVGSGDGGGGDAEGEAGGRKGASG
jgi:hypothetical protein